MAAQNLLETLKVIERFLIVSSDLWRKEISDKMPHVVALNVPDVENEMRREMQARLFGLDNVGKQPLPASMEKEVKRQSKLQVRGFYTLLKRKAKAGKVDVEIKFTKDSIYDFEAVITPKPGKSPKVFDFIKKGIKQPVQKNTRLFARLNKEVDKYNETAGKENQVEQITAQGAGFLDVGHADDSSVSLQRQEVVNQALYDFDVALNSKSPLTKKFLAELGENKFFTIKAEKGKQIDKLTVSYESKSANRRTTGKEGKGEVVELNKQLEKAIADLGGQHWLEQEASDSKLVRVEKEIMENIIPKKVKAKVTRKHKGPIKLGTTNAKGKNLKSKIRRPNTANAKDRQLAPVALPKRKSQEKKGVSGQQLQLLAILNNKLPEAVRKNMQSPALVNRTGRFADSVKVTDISVTRGGFPSVGYTYDRQNYGQYETTSGSRSYASSDRDPRKLIDKSMREIAVNLAIGRFYTRRQ